MNETRLIAELQKPEYREALEGEGSATTTQGWEKQYLHNQDYATIRSFFKASPTTTTRGTEYLLLSNQENLVDEESVRFRVQGYVTHADLPPITRSHSFPRDIAWTKQRIQICGLGSVRFSQALVAVLAIQEHLGRNIASMKTEEWQPAAFHQFSAIDLNSSYFVRARHASPSAFSASTDPDGILADKTKKADVVRNPLTLEEFYERKIGAMDGITKISYTEINPSSIRRGHMVDITLEFKLVSVKNQKWRLVIIPCAVAVIGRDIDEAYMRWRIEDAENKAQQYRQINLLKRNKPYNDEEAVMKLVESQEITKRQRPSYTSQDIYAANEKDQPTGGDISMKEK